jgi:hypothetical protein
MTVEIVVVLVGKHSEGDKTLRSGPEAGPSRVQDSTIRLRRGPWILSNAKKCFSTSSFQVKPVKSASRVSVACSRMQCSVPTDRSNTRLRRPASAQGRISLTEGSARISNTVGVWLSADTVALIRQSVQCVGEQSSCK